MFRRAVHHLLLWASVPFLLLAALSLGIFTWWAVQADRVLPDARYGNCFTYAAAKWARWGGWVNMRQADEIRLLWLPFPHAAWQADVNGPFRMTYPVARRKGKLPWWAVLFRYEVWAGDSPTSRTRWIESEPHPGWHETQPPIV